MVALSDKEREYFYCRYYYGDCGFYGRYFLSHTMATRPMNEKYHRRIEGFDKAREFCRLLLDMMVVCSRQLGLFTRG